MLVLRALLLCVILSINVVGGSDGGSCSLQVAPETCSVEVNDDAIDLTENAVLDGNGDGISCGCAASRRSVAGGGWSEESTKANFSASLQVAQPSAPRMRLCRIPAGSAVLGTDKPGLPFDGEAPAFSWSLAADIWLDETEVTIARFAAFVAASGYVSEAHTFGWSFVHELAVPPAVRDRIELAAKGTEWWLPVPNATWERPEGGELALEAGRGAEPAAHVSVRDAAAFCAFVGGRLPTEEEWEFAARGGKTDRRFPWGEALLTGPAHDVHRANVWQGTFPYNNTAEDGFRWASPVGAFPPQNAWGLRDMIGNVWEWTATPWCGEPTLDASARAAAATAGLPWAASSRASAPPDCSTLTPAERAAQVAAPGEIDYVKKGGSFMCHASYCYRYRSAARHKNTANSAAYNLGFRCAYDAPPPVGADDCLTGAPL